VRIKRTSKLITCVVLLLSSVSISPTLHSYHLLEKRRELANVMIQAIHASTDLLDGSNALTTAIRAYAATVGIFLLHDRTIVRCNRMLEEFVRAGNEVARQLAETGEYRNDLRLFRKDGTPFWVRTKAQMVNRSDASLGLVGIIG
jgi:PAS domain-containing protein